MKLKIFTLIGSPRYGNTYDLCKRFLQILQQFMNIDAEVKLVKEYNITPCTGCHRCVFEGECCIRDDLDDIKRSLLRSDLIILASPVYTCNVTYYLKLLLDRTAAWNHYPPLIGKKSIVIATTAYSCLQPVLQMLRSYVISWGTTCIAEIGSRYTDGRPMNGEILHRKLEGLAEHVLAILSGRKKPRPKLLDLILFNSFKIRAMTARDWNPKEYEYWASKGLLNRDYYENDVEIPLRHKVILKTILSLSLHRSYVRDLIVEM